MHQWLPVVGFRRGCMRAKRNPNLLVLALTGPIIVPPPAGGRGAPPGVYFALSPRCCNRISWHLAPDRSYPNCRSIGIITERTPPHNPFSATIILSGGRTHPFGGYDQAPLVKKFVRFRYASIRRSAMKRFY